MDLLTENKKYKVRGIAVIAALAVAVVAIVGLNIAGTKSDTKIEDTKAKVQVVRLLLQEKAEFITVNAMVQGCMARVNESPELVARFLEDKSICVQTIQPLALRVFNGKDDVCAIGDDHCAFASGFVRVVTATNQRPRTNEEVEQLTSLVESEYQKFKQGVQ